MDIFLAILLLVPGTNQDIQFDVVNTQLQLLCMQMQILDEKEIHYILSKSTDYDQDIECLRGRLKQYQDCPRIEDCCRLPSKEYLSEALAFNRAYKCNMDIMRSTVSHNWSYDQAYKEAEELYCIWDYARDAQCAYYYVQVRRTALQRLKELIGDEAFYQGQMPPFIPIWRFTPME